MKVAIVYCYPMVDSKRYFQLAKRFTDTWRRFPPPGEHRLYVACNGGRPMQLERRLFDGLGATFRARGNGGWDIGAYQEAAEQIPCDLLICLGANTHFHKVKWLELMTEAYVQTGPNLFGCWAYMLPNWHVRTTVFWCPPQLLTTYPEVVGSSRQERYEFEYGQKSFTRHTLGLGLDCVMVTRRGTFPFGQWDDNAPNARDSVVLDQHVHL